MIQWHSIQLFPHEPEYTACGMDRFCMDDVIPRASGDHLVASTSPSMHAFLNRKFSLKMSGLRAVRQIMGGGSYEEIQVTLRWLGDTMARRFMNLLA